MKARISAFFVAAALLLAGCGGGGGSPSTPSAPSNSGNASSNSGGTTASQPANDATVVATITIPSRTGSSAGHRTPQYVSSASKGLAVYVSQPGTGTFHVQSSFYDLTSATNCTTTPATGGTNGASCQINIPAPSGADEFYFVTYNVTPAGGTIATTSPALNAALASKTVAPGLNTLSINLTAIVDGVAVGQSSDAVAFGLTKLNTTTGTAALVSSISAASGALLISGALTSGVYSFFDAGTGGAASGILAATPPVTSTNLATLLSGLPPATGTGGYTTNTPVAPPAVKLTIADKTASGVNCGATGSSPHYSLAVAPFTATTSFNTAAATNTLVNAGDVVSGVYAGSGGVGYVAQFTSTAFQNLAGGGDAVTNASTGLTYSIATLGVAASTTSTTAANFTCSTQSLVMTSSNEVDVMDVVAGQTTGTALPADKTPGHYQIALGSGEGTTSKNCATVANVYIGPGTTNLVGTSTALINLSPTAAAWQTLTQTDTSGNGSVPTFVVTPINNPTIGNICTIAIQNIGGVGNGNTFNANTAAAPPTTYITVQVSGVSTGL